MKKPWRGRKSEIDSRLILAKKGRGEIRERASRFLAFARPVSSAEEAAEFLEGIRREYHDATHVAYAWRIWSRDSASERSSDAGEPPGTAGKPILDAIASAGVSDAAVAVVRYFGGTRLGTGGLSRAYRAAADAALAAAGIRKIVRTIRVTVSCPFERLGSARRLVRPPEITLAGETFDPGPVLELDVAASRLPGLLAALSEARLEHRVERKESGRR